MFFTFHANNHHIFFPFKNYGRSFPVSTVKIELSTGQNIQMFEVRVFSSGSNIATGKSSSQSSTLNNYGPRLAVDGKNNTFSHTNIATSGNPVWWKVDLGSEFAIESVTVLNRWCSSSADPNGCLCRLSSATVSLIAYNGDIVATQSVGNTCGKRELILDMFSSPAL